MLSLLIFLPLIGMLLIWGSPARFARSINVLTCGVALALNLFLAFQMEGWSNYQLGGDPASWIPALGINYEIGVDGLGMVLLLLTTFVSLVSAIASWRIDKYPRGYHMLFLLLLTAMLGVFVSLDLFLFYIFWELMLLPMYFLIGVWGGPNRKYASLKFFLYTLAGSVLLLAGVLITVFTNQVDGQLIWSIPKLLANGAGADLVGGTLGLFCFVAMFIGFAVKVPCFPFHTWLPDAHVEAPTPISMILAGVLLKMGGYGMIRVAWPFFPNAAAACGWLIGSISVIAIVYGAFVAMGQTDFKKMIAYSSVSHMGFVTLGLVAGTPEALNGAVYMMLAHGTISAMLFFIVGVIYERAHHRDMDRFGGLAWVMPRYFVFASFAFFASLGLPGLSGFIAEFTTFIGAFASPYRWWAVVALLGVVVSGAYYLIALQKIYLGTTPKVYQDPKTYPDLSARELAVLLPLAAVTLWMGLAPGMFMDIYKPFTDSLAQVLTAAMGG